MTPLQIQLRFFCNIRKLGTAAVCRVSPAAPEPEAAEPDIIAEKKRVRLWCADLDYSHFDQVFKATGCTGSSDISPWIHHSAVHRTQSGITLSAAPVSCGPASPAPTPPCDASGMYIVLGDFAQDGDACPRGTTPCLQLDLMRRVFNLAVRNDFKRGVCQVSLCAYLIANSSARLPVNYSQETRTVASSAVTSMNCVSLVLSRTQKRSFRLPLITSAIVSPIREPLAVGDGSYLVQSLVIAVPDGPLRVEASATFVVRTNCPGSVPPDAGNGRLLQIPAICYLESLIESWVLSPTAPSM